MRLDAALMGPDLDWLATRSEKVALLQTMTGSESSEHANQFPGTFPIGIATTGHVVVLYLATVPWTDDFRTFLLGHTALLRMASSWALRIVFPQPLRRVMEAYRAVVHEELESPLQADAIYDLKRYFFHRRRGTDLSTIPEALRASRASCSTSLSSGRSPHGRVRWFEGFDGFDECRQVRPFEQRASDAPTQVQPRVKGAAKTPFALAPTGRLEAAIVWTHLIMVGRYASLRTLARLTLIVISLGVMASFASRRKGLATVAAGFCLVLTARR